MQTTLFHIRYVSIPAKERLYKVVRRLFFQRVFFTHTNHQRIFGLMRGDANKVRLFFQEPIRKRSQQFM